LKRPRVTESCWRRRKKRGEKRKFSKECGVSISSLNRLEQRYDREGFLGLIDKRNRNPNRNIEAHELVKKFQAAVHPGLQG
jgi:transposase